MYTLTLTQSERSAFDWIGNRYSSGQIADWLIGTMPDSDDWANPGEITFSIPENVAWQISELANEDDSRFPCFAPELVGKLEALIDSIV